MLAYITGDGLTRMYRGFQRLANPSNWMAPLLQEFEQIIVDDNRAFLMMGRDIHGQNFKPVKRKHGGPPLLEGRNRAISMLMVTSKQTGRNTFVIEKDWPNFRAKNGRQILAMHSNPGPKARYPRRDAFGYHDETIVRINQASRRFMGRELKSIFAQPGGGYLMGQR